MVRGVGVRVSVGAGGRVHVTGGVPGQPGVYIRISVAVWFHSFCS